MTRVDSAVLGSGLVLMIAVVSPCAAAVCTVPSAPHPAIQEAVDDLACTEIVLAAGTFVEEVVIDRDLVITGASSPTTRIEGRVVVEGDTTQVGLHDLTIDASAPTAAGCFTEALVSRGGAQLGANDVVVPAGHQLGLVVSGASMTERSRRTLQKAVGRGSIRCLASPFCCVVRVVSTPCNRRSHEFRVAAYITDFP